MRARHMVAVILSTAPIAATAADFGPLPPPVATLEVVDPRQVDERVVSGIHAGGDNAADIALADEVATRLALDRRLDGATVTVVADGGDVSLTGSAVSNDQGQVAQELARQVEGVERVTGTLHDAGS